MINTHNGIKERGINPINIEDYPAIKTHLDLFYPLLVKRTDKGNTPYNLRNCAYMDDFYKQKIVWGNLNLQAGFSFAPAGYFVNAPSPLIASESNFLLTFLNSKIADYYIRSLGVTRNGGYFEYKPMFVELLPIPDYLKDESLEQKCRELLSKKTENFEDSINKIFYELYQLSTEEIEFIESR